jgi:hypothetical protein
MMRMFGFSASASAARKDGIADKSRTAMSDVFRGI